MYKGFYNLTSGMLTQQRYLNVVANNMVNISTAGFKAERYTSSTFDDVMYSMAGNKYKDYQDIGRQSYIRATSQTYVDYTQGTLEPTGIVLDFGIQGRGFFAIRNNDGETMYTRAGSFSLDDEGYLCLSYFGRVVGADGQFIQLPTDKITTDGHGRIYRENGDFLGQIGVYDFEDYEAQLEHNRNGYFTGEGAQLMENPVVLWQYLERSNTDMVSVMTQMIEAQRAFQSVAQVSKMYDQLMSKATTDLGRL